MYWSNKECVIFLTQTFDELKFQLNHQKSGQKVDKGFSFLNRVHCANLFEQTTYFRTKYSDEVQNGSDSSTIEDTNKTLTTLNMLYDTSGCKTAMCIFLAGRTCLHLMFLAKKIHLDMYYRIILGSMADSVTQASWGMDFEDGSRMRTKLKV